MEIKEMLAVLTSFVQCCTNNLETCRCVTIATGIYDELNGRFNYDRFSQKCPDQYIDALPAIVNDYEIGREIVVEVKKILDRKLK